MRRFIWALGVSVICLSGLELSFRLIEQPQMVEENGVLPPDPDLLWRQPVGIRSNQGVEVRINEFGMRGPEVRPKQSDELRLLSVGDSSVFGFLVEEAESYTAVACEKIACTPMILASPGYSTVQSLVWLSHVGAEVQPDWVVIGNLWSDQSVVGFQDKDLVRDYQVYRKKWQWQLLRGLRKSALFNRTRAFIVGDQNQQYRDVAWQHGWNQGDRGDSRVPLQDYAENLAALTSLSHSIGAQVAFVGLAKKSEMDGAVDTRAMAYRSLLKQASILAEAPYVDAQSVWKAADVPSEQLFADFLHPSAEGHRLLGLALAEAIQQSALVHD